MRRAVITTLAVLALGLAPGLAHSPSSEAATGTAAISCKKVRIDPRLARVRYQSPADQLITEQMGPVTLTTYNPVSMNEYVSRTNIYFDFTNTSAAPVTVRLLDWSTLVANRPDFVFFLQAFAPNDHMRDNAVLLDVPAGATRTMELFASKDSRGAQSAEATLTFSFDVLGMGYRTYLPITFAAYDRYGPSSNLHLTPSARIQGRVTDTSGRPIRGAQVTITPLLGNASEIAFTKADGTYAIDITSTPGLKQLHGARPIAEPFTYALAIDKQGRQLAHRTGLTFAQGEVKACNTRLGTVPQLDYALIGEAKTSGPEGFWKIEFFGSGDRVVAIKGWHDANDEPVYVVAVDLAGNELWRHRTGTRCWGLDVSPDGQKIAVACADHKLTVLDVNGIVLHEEVVSDRQNNSHALSWSPDSTILLANYLQEGGSGLQAIDTRTWTRVWADPLINAYHAYWTNSPAQIIVTDSDGRVRSYTTGGQVRWTRSIGNTPIFLAVDDAGRVFTGGKSHDLFAWDADGNPLWRVPSTQKIMRNVDGYGVARDGSLLVVSTFSEGFTQALNAKGQVLWQRYLPRKSSTTPQGDKVVRFIGPGHNAVFVAPTGDFAMVGTLGNQWVRYDRFGAIQYASPVYPVRAGYPVDKEGSYQQAAQSLIATPDGKTVAVAFTDSTIRIYRQR